MHGHPGVRGRKWVLAAGVSLGSAALAVAVLAAPSKAGAVRPPPHATSTLKPPAYVWPKIAHDPGNNGFSPDPAISQANAGKLGVRWMVGTGATTVSSPVVAWNATLHKTLVYLANDAGDLTAFDAATGATVWSVNLGSPIESSPLVEGGYVWVSRTYSPTLYKLDAATGAISCQVPLTSLSEGSPTIGTPKGGSPTIYLGVLDLGTQSGPIYAIAEATCAIEFQSTNFNSITGSWDPLSYATDRNGRGLVLMGTSDPDDSVYAFDAVTGAKVWSFLTPPLPGNTDTDVGAGLTVSPPGAGGIADGAAYVPAEDGYLFAFDLTTGGVLWRYDYGVGLPQVHLSRSTPALVDGKLIFGDSGGVMAVNAATGTLAWKFATGIESLSDPAVVGPAGSRAVAVTTLGGAFDVLNADTGALLYQLQTPTFTTSSFAESDGNLFVASADGYLYDLAPGGGNGAAPTTAVISPASGSSVAHPAGPLRIAGTAKGSAIAGVTIAVQSGGASGPWWDATSTTWIAGFHDNAASLATPGKPSTTWSFALPVPRQGGQFRVLVSAYQLDGIADISDLSPTPGAANVTFGVAHAAGSPYVVASGGGWAAPGSAVELTGSGFAPSEKVSFSCNGVADGSAKVSSAGALAATAVTIPRKTAFGPTMLVVTGESSKRVGTAAIDVSNSWVGAGAGALHGNAEPNDKTLLDYVSPGPPLFLRTAWIYPSGAAVKTSVAVLNDVAYFANDAGTVTALNIRNSVPFWTKTEVGGIDSSPALADSKVFFGTRRDSVVALKQSNGARVWSTATTSAVESAPAVVNGRLYVGSDDGMVYALDDATGAIVWHAKLAGSVLGSPTVDATANLVVVGDKSGAVTALSAATGAVVWSDMTGGAVTATASIANGIAYVGSADGDAYAYSEANGNKLWSVTTPGPITAGGVVYDSTTKYGTQYVVGSSDGTISYISATAGVISASAATGGPVIGLAGTSGWITATTSNGEVWGLKRMAELEWQTTATAPFASSPVVVDGVVYTTGTDQTVRSYTVPGVPIP